MGEDLPGAVSVLQLKSDRRLDQTDWQQLWLAAGHSTHPCRDRCLLQLFWHVGPTVSTTVALRLEQIDFLTSCLRGAAANGAAVRMAPELLRSLSTYVSLERPARGGPTLFVGRHGRPLRPEAIDRAFRAMSAASGVAADPQRLRRQALLRQLAARPVATLRQLRPRTV